MIKMPTVNEASICDDPLMNATYNQIFQTYIGELSELGRAHGIPQISVGAEHPVLAATILRFAHLKMARRILEIGTEVGLTTYPLALYATLFDGFVVGYDPLSPQWSATPEWWNIFEPWMRDRGATHFEFRQKNFEDAAHETEEPYDMVFIDHHKPMYLQAFKALVEGKMVTNDAWILLHDVDPETAMELFANREMNGDHLTWKPVVSYCLETDCGKPTLVREGAFGTLCYDLGLVELGVSNA